MLRELTEEAYGRKAADGGIIPVYREYLADMDTPVSALAHLGPSEDAFLLESVAGGTGARYSFLGVEPRETLIADGPTVLVRRAGGGIEFAEGEGGFLGVLRKRLAGRGFRPDPDLPPREARKALRDKVFAAMNETASAPGNAEYIAYRPYREESAFAASDA